MLVVREVLEDEHGRLQDVRAWDAALGNSPASVLVIQRRLGLRPSEAELTLLITRAASGRIATQRCQQVGDIAH